jgi:hypothetical protein
MSLLEGPVPDARRTEVGGVVVDEVAAGACRVKRVIYPSGWVWAESMAAVVGTDWCEHAHVGFLVQGSMELEYRDGCVVTNTAPCAVVVEPGHRGRVVGEEAAVLVQVDAGAGTVERFGLEGAGHRHGSAVAG